MKRIALISLHTPTPTNYRGASALPYHLLAFRPEDVEVEVWSFNLNGCSPDAVAESEKRLGVKINIISRPKWFGLLMPAPVRLLLPKPLLGYLRVSRISKSDIEAYLCGGNSALWIYGEDIAHLARVFSAHRTVITTPDCEAMYYYRVLGMRNLPKNKASMLRYGLMYHRYSRFAAKYPTGEKICYHLVGKADCQFLKGLNPRVNAIFMPHPHYDAISVGLPRVSESGLIRLLIAGRYDFAMAQAVDDAVAAMVALPDAVKRRYHVTFLGKGWDECCGRLAQSGFSTEIKGFVQDYAAEIASHHIQLTPIAVGTGTKGKVLDAFANGLMVIGTPLALENIEVRNGKECVEYSSAEELGAWLARLSEKPGMISDMAKAGRDKVLSEHSREKIATKFFCLFE